MKCLSKLSVSFWSPFQSKSVRGTPAFQRNKNNVLSDNVKMNIIIYSDLTLSQVSRMN